MRKKIKEPEIRCNACGGQGWIEVPLKHNPGSRNAPHNSRLVQKRSRCHACGGKGVFK